MYDGVRLPFDDAVFDACVSNYVLEHVEHPREHFFEVARVLKPGGVYCFRTPNVAHYVALISRLLPHRIHLSWANWLRRLGDDAHDPYPTHYRANSVAAITRHARLAGLVLADLHYVEAEPSYGRSHPLLFYPMMLYERAVNATRMLAGLRMTIQAVLTKEQH